MPFVTFTLGQQMPFPGEFVRIVNAGPPGLVVPNANVAAFLGTFDKGPLNTPTAISDIANLQAIFGATNTGYQPVVNALNAGAPEVLVTRVGTGGTAGLWTLKLSDGTTAAVTVPLASVGTDAANFTLTVRDSLYNTTQRELVLYYLSGQVLVVPFLKGAGGAGSHGESGALVTALNAANSGAAGYFGTAALVGTPGDTTLLAAATSIAPTTAGADPTVNNGTYTGAGMTALQTQSWTYLFTDSVDQSLAASLTAFINHQRSNGQFCYGIVGEPTSVARATREADALALNNIAITYVGNGYTDANGAEQGAAAIGTYVGVRASSDYDANLTGFVVPFALPGKTNILDYFAEPSDKALAIADGMFLFDVNAQGQAKFEYDINTFVAATSTYHQGWRYNSVVQTYDHMLREIGATWDQLTGLLNNPAGRGTVLQVGQRVLNQMVAEGSLQNDGQALVYQDPNNPPSADQFWMVLQANTVYPLTKLYLTALLQFAPTVTG